MTCGSFNLRLSARTLNEEGPSTLSKSILRLSARTLFVKKNCGIILTLRFNTSVVEGLGKRFRGALYVVIIINTSKRLMRDGIHVATGHTFGHERF